MDSEAMLNSTLALEEIQERQLEDGLAYASALVWTSNLVHLGLVIPFNVCVVLVVSLTRSLHTQCNTAMVINGLACLVSSCLLIFLRGSIFPGLYWNSEDQRSTAWRVYIGVSSFLFRMANNRCREPP